MITRSLQCDVLVAGGGAAGVPCALAAARRGASVILCQDRPVLGGNASSEVRMHIVGANGTGTFDRGENLRTEAREGGIVEEIRLDNCVLNPQRSASVFDLILYDKCRQEPNLQLLLNTTVVAAETRERHIRSIRAERQSTEERFEITARVFVDCTGDGRLGFEAGAAFVEGREGKETHGETLAPAKADNWRLGSTILLQARKHDRAMPFTAPTWAREFSQQDLRLRLYATPGEEEPTHEYGYWWAEWGGTLDTIRDNEQIRDELLAIALGIWDHIKNGPPEYRVESRGSDSGFQADRWALDWIGFLPGKRESRRFIGRHVLTEHDVLESRAFADAIAFGGWSLDLHPPEGVDAIDELPCVQHPVPHLYDIPLRACLARDMENLMFAGRCMSATHVAFSSTRVMGTCGAVGQGVGVAAAYAARHGMTPVELPGDSEAMRNVQRQLRADDAHLLLPPGGTFDDPAELQSFARLSASSDSPGGSVENIRSGETRATHGARGAPKDRRTEGAHRWMSAPRAGAPEWVELQWDEPQPIGQVSITFDTGMHRHLTLSHHDGYTGRMHWGSPQPETVRDYKIQSCDLNGTWRTLASVSNNYQRRRQHLMPIGHTTSRLRILIERTNGLDHARIVELRVHRPVNDDASLETRAVAVATEP